MNKRRTFRNHWTQFPFGGRKLCANNDEVRSCRHSKNESCANAHTRMSAVCIYIFYLRRFSLPRRKNAENIKVNVMIRYDEHERKKKKRSTRAAPLHGSVWEQYQRQQLYTMTTTANWLLRQQQHWVHKNTSQSSWISDMENAKKLVLSIQLKLPHTHREESVQPAVACACAWIGKTIWKHTAIYTLTSLPSTGVFSWTEQSMYAPNILFRSHH